MSQVASWSSEAVPSSSGPMRRVTGRLRHWEPRARQGGTVGFGAAEGWAETAMLYQGERSACVGRKLTRLGHPRSLMLIPLPFGPLPLILVLVRETVHKVGNLTFRRWSSDNAE